MWWYYDGRPHRREAHYVPGWNKSRLRRQSILRHTFSADAPIWRHRPKCTTRSTAQVRQQKRRIWIQNYRAMA